MREYWQRRPLLLRKVFPDFLPPVNETRLLELAARDDVESRLVLRSGQRWVVRPGPLRRRDRLSLSRRRWTLLVHGLDLIDPGAHGLMSRFRFLPDARLDDLMVSFATDGGGVGPHVDNYDVFLLQARGRRRWRISRQRDLRLKPGLPLRILADFRPTHSWVVETGDLLYLPPGVAHDGVALGESLTYSIGFRAPAFEELHDPWLMHFAQHTTLRGRYGDPGLRATRHPGTLPAVMVRRIHRVLSARRPSLQDTERFLLEYLSEPKAQVVFTPRPEPLSPAAFRRLARRHGLVLDMRSRMLTGETTVAVNGETFVVPSGAWPALQALADRRVLTPGELSRPATSLWPLLRDWLHAGWLHFGQKPPTP